jgi:DhnA family fructose-bisphosphate aldolase class Ia
MLLGKKIRLNRLFNHESGKYISIALDHAIYYEQYEIPKGIQNISETIGQIVMGDQIQLFCIKESRINVL